jgi:hypothetical protein
MHLFYFEYVPSVGNFIVYSGYMPMLVILLCMQLRSLWNSVSIMNGSTLLLCAYVQLHICYLFLFFHNMVIEIEMLTVEIHLDAT